MKTKRLGNSDLNITPIGFGAWAIGGTGWQFAWGTQNDEDSIAAIWEAMDAGVNWIDTAAVYGLGHSEEIVARALEGVYNQPFVFTKCSMVWDERCEIGHRLKAQSIRQECEASLRRLRVEAIDLYQIHWPDPDEDIEEGWTTLRNSKQKGKYDISVSLILMSLRCSVLRQSLPSRPSNLDILYFIGKSNRKSYHLLHGTISVYWLIPRWPPGY